jgi:hypothetical protein
MSISTGKTNTTPQVDDHASHHNALAVKVNQLDGRVDDLESAVPPEGSKDYVLRKASNASYDTEWASVEGLKGPKGDKGDKGDKGNPGPKGNDGAGLPIEPDGEVGQYLRLKDADPVKAEWHDVHQVPAGGTTGQALVKASDDAHDVEWADVSGGGGGGGSLPDPAGEPDGNVLSVLSGSAVWAAPSGGGGGGGGGGMVTSRWVKHDFGYSPMVKTFRNTDGTWITGSHGGTTGDVMAIGQPVDQHDVVFGGQDLIAFGVVAGCAGAQNTWWGCKADVPLIRNYGGGMGMFEFRGDAWVRTNVAYGSESDLNAFVQGGYVWVPSSSGGYYRRPLLGAENSYVQLASDYQQPDFWGADIQSNGITAWGVNSTYGVVRLGAGSSTWEGGFYLSTSGGYVIAVAQSGTVWAARGSSTGDNWKVGWATPLSSTMTELDPAKWQKYGNPWRVPAIGATNSGKVVMLLSYRTYSNPGVHVVAVYDPAVDRTAYHIINRPTNPVNDLTGTGGAYYYSNRTATLAVWEADGYISFPLWDFGNAYGTITISAAV